jgi:hypothetical protein
MLVSIESMTRHFFRRRVNATSVDVICACSFISASLRPCQPRRRGPELGSVKYFDKNEKRTAIDVIAKDRLGAVMHRLLEAETARQGSNQAQKQRPVKITLADPDSVPSCSFIVFTRFAGGGRKACAGPEALWEPEGRIEHEWVGAPRLENQALSSSGVRTARSRLRHSCSCVFIRGFHSLRREGKKAARNFGENEPFWRCLPR